LALRALDVGDGDEVIVPAMTFVATAEAVVHAGATPVLADVDPVTLLLDEAGVAAVRTDRTRAVVPVHLFGHVVPFSAIQAWRDEGLVVVEDAAQAHLATWQGAPVGAHADAACFSFYPGKNLGALGDGGAVTAGDMAVVGRVATLRDHGSDTKYRHETIGWCTRLDGLQARLLDVKLRHLEEWTDARRRVADRYRDNLGRDVLVPWEDGAVHHLVVARIPDGRRPHIQEALSAAGIGWGVHYPHALSDQPALAPWHRACPAAEQAGAEVLSLPVDPLMETGEVDEVCAVLSGALV
jgi:dTDP-3-amino-3,4,6-trideoxy-alpha-D-glucose transaminase